MNENGNGMSRQEVADVKAEIRERFPNVPWTDVIRQPVCFGVGGDVIYEGKVGITTVNPASGEKTAVGIASKEYYNLVPHEVATHRLLQAIPHLDMGEPEFKFHMWDNGAKFKVDFRFVQEDYKLKNVGDKVGYGGYLRNSVDCSTRLEAGNGFIEIL